MLVAVGHGSPREAFIVCRQLGESHREMAVEAVMAMARKYRVSFR
jgi:hypothetical protein